MLDPASWLDEAKALDEGQRKRTTHDCGPGKVLFVDHKRNGWGAYCVRCSDKGWVPRPQESLTQRIKRLSAVQAVEQVVERDVRPPQPANYDPSSWPMVARVWLYKAGLSNDKIKSLGFYYHEPTKRVVLPVLDGGRLVHWQARGFDPELPKYLNPPGGRAVFRHGPKPDRGTPVVITEDILSSVRVGSSGVAQGWCIMGTSIPDSVMLEIMRTEAPALVWLDPDAAGQRGVAKFVPKLRAFGVDARRLTSAKDPKLHTTEEIIAVIRPDTAAAT